MRRCENWGAGERVRGGGGGKGGPGRQAEAALLSTPPQPPRAGLGCFQLLSLPALPPLRLPACCRQDECERVTKAGARVLTLDQLEGLKVGPAVAGAQRSVGSPGLGQVVERLPLPLHLLPACRCSFSGCGLPNGQACSCFLSPLLLSHCSSPLLLLPLLPPPRRTPACPAGLTRTTATATRRGSGRPAASTPAPPSRAGGRAALCQHTAALQPIAATACPNPAAPARPPACFCARHCCAPRLQPAPPRLASPRLTSPCRLGHVSRTPKRGAGARSVPAWQVISGCGGQAGPGLTSPLASPPLPCARSIGDAAAEDIGVIADPEVTLVRLGPGQPFLILATDGVWEFVSSQKAVDIVSRPDAWPELGSRGPGAQREAEERALGPP